MSEDRCNICKHYNTYGKEETYILEEGGFFSTTKIIKICKNAAWTGNDCHTSLNAKFGANKWYKKFGRKERTKAKYRNYSGIIKNSVKEKFENLDKLKKDITEITKQRQEENEKLAVNEEKRESSIINELKKSIIQLLIDKTVKIPASDIDAHLKHQNVDEIKELCEEMYHNGKIGRTGNYRYFILTEEKKKPKPKKASAPKSESTDIPEQIKKLSDLKDQGILTEEEFQSKKKDLLDKM